MSWRYEKGLHDLGRGHHAYLVPDGSWGWSNAASEIKPRGRSDGRIALAGGYASHGEPARLERGPRGEIVEVRLGGTRYRSEIRVVREMAGRYRVVR